MATTRAAKTAKTTGTTRILNCVPSEKTDTGTAAMPIPTLGGADAFCFCRGAPSTRGEVLPLSYFPNRSWGVPRAPIMWAELRRFTERQRCTALRWTALLLPFDARSGLTRLKDPTD